MEKKNKELLLKKVDELVDIIKESDDYKRYIELKTIMENNKEIMKLVKNIKSLQQKTIKLEYNKQDTTKEEKELQSLKDELNSYPIYQEYIYLQEDLNDTFQNIKVIIEKSVERINS